MNNLHIIHPSEYNLSPQQFADLSHELVDICMQEDNTLVQRTKDEYKKYYDHSVLLEHEGKVIGKSSIIPSNKISYPHLNIGETIGTLIHPMYRNKGYGSLLVEETEKIIGKDYDIIIGGTINNIMSTIRQNRGYQSIEFPPQLYEEGKKFFVPLLDGGEDEFQQRATCLIKFAPHITEQTKIDFLHLFICTQ